MSGGEHEPSSGVPNAARPAATPGSTSPLAPGAARGNPGRYGWTLRIFIGAFLFDMVVRSLMALTPYDKEWRTDLAMERYPLPLPTRRQLRDIEEAKDPSYADAGERYSATFASLLRYGNPWPSQETRGNIEGPSDAGRYALTWLGTRLGFVGALLGVDQNWPMFAPNVRRSRLLPRAKLYFEDGSSQQVWLLGEPWDLTDYSRWFIKRPLQVDIRLHADYDARLGVSRHLARIYSLSEAGSPLSEIELHKVRYHLPTPEEDAYRTLLRQNQKPLNDDPFWRYDVKTRRGKTLEDSFERKKRERKERGAGEASP